LVKFCKKLIINSLQKKVFGLFGVFAKQTKQGRFIINNQVVMGFFPVWWPNNFKTPVLRLDSANLLRVGTPGAYAGKTSSGTFLWLSIFLLLLPERNFSSERP